VNVQVAEGKYRRTDEYKSTLNQPNNPCTKKMDDVAIPMGGSIFSSAWFWLLIVSLLFFVAGIILLALVGTGWGVIALLLGLLFLIVAGAVGLISSTRKTAVDLLNSPAGSQLVETVINRRVTENVPVQRQVTENVPVTRTITENVPRTRTITENVPVQRQITENVPVTRMVTQSVPVTRNYTQVIRNGQVQPQPVQVRSQSQPSAVIVAQRASPAATPVGFQPTQNVTNDPLNNLASSISNQGFAGQTGRSQMISGFSNP
jgi:hypothetical protein